MKVEPGVTIHKSDNGAFVMNEKAGGCFALNAAGVAMFEMIESGRTVEEIVGALAGDYPDADAERIRADVHDFVSALVKRALVRE